MAVKIREKKNKSGKISLYLDIYYKGQRTYEFLNLYYTKDSKSKKQVYEVAEQIRARKEIEFVESDYNLVSTERKKQDFIFYLEKSFSRNTSYKALHKLLKKFHDDKKNNGILSFTRINESYLEEFKTYLLETVSQNTASSYWSLLKAVFNRAIKEKIIQSNPAKFISIQKLDTEKSFLTENELRLLAETETRNEEVKRGFLFSCYTGLRISDIAKLKWSDIHENKIQFRQKKTKAVEYLPLNQTAINIISEQRKYNSNNEYVFVIPPSSTLNDIFTEWIKETGINKKITFHTARHTFATLSLSSGVDIYTVSKLLGHKSIATTQIYAKIVNESLTTAVNSLPDLEISKSEYGNEFEQQIIDVGNNLREGEDRFRFEFFNMYDLEEFLYRIEKNERNSNSLLYKSLELVYSIFDWELLVTAVDNKAKEVLSEIKEAKLSGGFYAVKIGIKNNNGIQVRGRIYNLLYFALMKSTNTKFYTDSIKKESIILENLTNDIEELNSNIEKITNYTFNRNTALIHMLNINKDTVNDFQISEEDSRYVGVGKKFFGRQISKHNIARYTEIFKRNDNYFNEYGKNNYRSEAFIVSRKELKYDDKNEQKNLYNAFMSYRKEHKLETLEDFEKYLSSLR